MLKEILAKIYLLQVSKKKDAELLWLATYQYLCGDQIIAILKIIDAEVVKSFHFGLKLSHDHLFKEKAAVLCILNQMGNLDQIPEKADYEEVYKIFSKALRKVMEDEALFYFNQLAALGKGRTMYNCHLESVVYAVLRAIYDGEIPYTKKTVKKRVR